MGYAERHSRTFLAVLNCTSRWGRIRLSLPLLWSPAMRRGTLQHLKGGFWRWLLHGQDLVAPAPKPTAAQRETRELRSIAARIRDEAHLEEVLESIKDDHQRAVLRTRLRAILKERKR